MVLPHILRASLLVYPFLSMVLLSLESVVKLVSLCVVFLYKSWLLSVHVVSGCEHASIRPNSIF